MTLSIDIFYPKSPADTGKLIERLKQLSRDGIRRLAVLGKTEGSATLNDFSRDLAQRAVDDCLREVGGNALLDCSIRFFSTGCEGIASPLLILAAESGIGSTGPTLERGLVLGAGASLPIPDADRAGLKHIEAARQAVLTAMEDARLMPHQVELVLIKSPIMSKAQASRLGGNYLRHGGSTGSSRGAAAIGAALALGEIEEEILQQDPVGRVQAYTNRTMAFSGTETDCIETVVFGTRPGGDPRWGIKSRLTHNIAEVEPLRGMLGEAAAEPTLVLFKAGIPPDGMLFGRRTTVLTSDLSPDKQLRASASGIIAACFGETSAFISAGGEHLGPPGACLCTLILKK